ncbi:MAG: sugar kinase [Nitrospirae bacterium]|nr:sugar kinase [Nitrospirota bacterium]
MKVVGLGQCSLDHLFVIDSFPAPDTKKEVMKWTISGGGPVATALVGLSRLGVACAFYGIIGDDESGVKIAESLRSEHINIDGLLIRSKSCSQAAFIAVEKGSGRRTIFWKRPSAKPLEPQELPDDFLNDAGFLLVDGLMAEASLYAARKAREKNIPVMLDAGRVREGMLELAHLCDYVVCSEEFARELMKPERDIFHKGGANHYSFNPEIAVNYMKSFGVKAATITLGDKGSKTVSDGEIFHTPAFKVDVVDTTGAGDVFHGGYIYGLLQGWDLKEVVRFASAFAALKCRKLGGRAGIPSLEETKEFVNRVRLT